MPNRLKHNLVVSSCFYIQFSSGIETLFNSIGLYSFLLVLKHYLIQSFDANVESFTFKIYIYD